MAQPGSAPHHLDDVTWAQALANQDPEAFLRYEREIVPVIAAHLRRRRFNDEQIREIQQTLRVRLFVGDHEHGPSIAAYAGRGKLIAFVLVAALREAVRSRSRDRREVAQPDDVLLLLAQRGDPTTVEPGKERYRELFRVAFRAAISGLHPRTRMLLRLHLIDELTIDQIGVLMGVHRATAARWIEDARTEIASIIHRDLAAQLGTDRFEIENLLGWIRSRVELSLSGLQTVRER